MDNFVVSAVIYSSYSTTPVGIGMNLGYLNLSAQAKALNYMLTWDHTLSVQNNYFDSVLTNVNILQSSSSLKRSCQLLSYLLL